MTMRVLACPTRQPGESGQAFIDRMLAHLDAKKGAASAAPPKVEITAKTAKVVKEARAKTKPATQAETERAPTKLWPPLPGQRYIGAWPPPGLRCKGPSYRPGVTLPLDEGQKAWLQRYAEKYPDACNPYTQVTVAEAKAREARQLRVSS
jgi:hypothetical protein